MTEAEVETVKSDKIPPYKRLYPERFKILKLYAEYAVNKTNLARRYGCSASVIDKILIQAKMDRSLQ